MNATKRRNYLLGAVTVLSFLPADWMFVKGPAWEILAVRLPWAAAYAAFGLLATNAPPERLRLFASILSAVSGVGCVGLIATTGGRLSPFLYVLPVLPLLVARLEEDHTTPTWVAGAFCFGGVFSIDWAHTQQSLGEAACIGLGVVAATLWSVRGLQASRRLRESAIESARLASVGRLAAGVAHEINNPLAYVTANVGWMAELGRSLSPPADDSMREVAEETEIGLGRIRAIVEDLRDLARLSPVKIDPFQLDKAVAEALRVVRLRLPPKVGVAVELGASLPLVNGDRGRVVQVLINLLANAGDALQTTESPRIVVWARAEEGRVVIAIEDNGPGLPSEVRKRLFQAFVSTKAAGAGLGLGLSLAKQYIDQQGGKLAYEKAPGAGARFVIELPAAAQLDVAVAA